MRIDCNLCGATDRVWGAFPYKVNRVPETMEVGTQHVACRKCKATGYVTLDVECANCKGHDLWRWTTRSMDSNTRRWMCRDCGEVTASHKVATMFQTPVPPPSAMASLYKGRTLPLCSGCGQGTLSITARDCMERAWCVNTICTSRRTTFKVHDKRGKSTVVSGTGGPPPPAPEPEEPRVFVFDDDSVLEF